MDLKGIEAMIQEQREKDFAPHLAGLEALANKIANELTADGKVPTMQELLKAKNDIKVLNETKMKLSTNINSLVPLYWSDYSEEERRTLILEAEKGSILFYLKVIKDPFVPRDQVLQRYPCYHCLTPEEVTLLRSNSGKKIQLFPIEPWFEASIDDCLVSEIEADKLLGKGGDKEVTNKELKNDPAKNHCRKAGAIGGRKSKKDQHIANIVQAEVEQGRGFHEFIEKVRNSDDGYDQSEIYKDLHIKKNEENQQERLHYTYTCTTPLTTGSRAIRSLERYFKEAKTKKSS
jgi:hypothetical protein